MIRFSSARQITTADVKDIVPLDLLEDDIQYMLENIIKEPFREKDWGGERSDIYTRRIEFRGRKITAAFLLKGRGLKGTLTPAKAGKRGDQIARLFSEPAELFVIQHVDKIDSSVDQQAESYINKLRSSGNEAWFCIIDGTDTARLLVGYGFICRHCGQERKTTHKCLVKELINGR